MLTDPKVAKGILNGFGGSKHKAHIKAPAQIKKVIGVNKNAPLGFYDLRTRKKFTSADYKLVKKKVNGKTRTFAVAKAPSGSPSWRIVG